MLPPKGQKGEDAFQAFINILKCNKTNLRFSKDTTFFLLKKPSSEKLFMDDGGQLGGVSKRGDEGTFLGP